MLPDSVRELHRLELQCFGAPSARLDGQAAPPQVLWHKHLALLVYLALSPNRTRTRSHLHGLLWPETADDQARHSLNMALSRLRLELGEKRLASAGDGITLSDQRLDVDALRCDAAFETDPAEAIRLMPGDFLEGFDVDGAHAFEEWCTERRRHYRAQAVIALVRVGEEALARARYPDAISTARRALVLEPYSEPAMSLLMRASGLSGDQAGALAAFRDFEACAAHIGERPSRELTELADRVRSQRWRASRPGRAGQTPLVGREAVHRTAFGVLADGIRPGVGPRVLLITGDPGTGKTRLLGECLDRLALQGAVVAVARPLESDQDAPWSTLCAVVRAGLLTAPGSAAVDPGALRVLTRITEDVPGTLPTDVAQVGAALGSLLRAVADEQPVALGIHDAQYCDDASLDALGAAITHVGELPVVAVLTATATWDQVPPALLRIRAELGRNLPGAEVRLEPFTDSE